MILLSYISCLAFYILTIAFVSDLFFKTMNDPDSFIKMLLCLITAEVIQISIKIDGKR